MKPYPKIYGSDRGFMEADCVAFDKLDGSNIRFEFSKKTGWYKFGTRTRVIDEKHPEYGPAWGIFMAKYAEGIEKVLKDRYPKVESAIAFAEFFGPNSFAGQHDIQTLNGLGFDVKHNEPKNLILFDVELYKQCMMAPREFVARFENLGIPRVVYEGRLTQQFVDGVREGTYDVKEGVICKGGARHGLWMMKIKTNAYKEELKKRWGELWNQHWE